MAKEKVKKSRKEGQVLFALEAEPKAPAVAPRFKARYRDDAVPALKKEFGYTNIHKVPTISKITVNMGLGKAVNNPNIVGAAMNEMSLIAGQRAVITRARKSISNFKLREGMPIGCMVTLRGDRMWEFFDRLVSVALPRTRDFRGVSGKAFDGTGNYNLGVKEHAIFPEVDIQNLDDMKGMNITIATTAKSDAEGKALLKELGFPFRN